MYVVIVEAGRFGLARAHFERLPDLVRIDAPVPGRWASAEQALRAARRAGPWSGQVWEPLGDGTARRVEPPALAARAGEALRRDLRFPAGRGHAPLAVRLAGLLLGWGPHLAPWSWRALAPLLATARLVSIPLSRRR